MATRRIEYPITAEDFERRTFSAGKEELVRGFVLREPAPGGRRGAVVARLVAFLANRVEQARLRGTVRAGPGLIVARGPAQVRVPDVAYVGADRAGAVGAGMIRGAADLAVEVLSPGNRPEDIAARIDDQFRAGARLCWAVDPAARAVTVHFPDGTRVLLGSEDTLDGGDVLPGLAIRVSGLFPG